MKKEFYCPASISLLFRVCPNRNPLKAGSVGVGFTVDQGVKVRVEEAGSSSVLFNGRKISFPTVLSVVNHFGKRVNVSISSNLPLGYGFGLSGACALAAASALNNYFKAQKTEKELTGIAHTAEIENRTGLGTVGTVSEGGFFVKTAPGLPVKGFRLPFAGRKLYALMLGQMLTPKILENKGGLGKINRAADRALKRIKHHTPLKQILDLAYEYDLASSLLTDHMLLNTIKRIKSQGGHATMAKLGKVIITDLKPVSGDYPVIEFIIENSRPVLL